MPALFDSSGLSADEKQLIAKVLDAEPSAVWVSIDTRTDPAGKSLEPIVIFATRGTHRLDALDIDQDLADRLCAAYWANRSTEHKIPIQRVGLPASTTDSVAPGSAGPVAA